MPPEFLALGLLGQGWEPWTPVDSLSVIRLMSLHLSWSWQSDLKRSRFHMQHPNVSALAEELFPFSPEFLYDMVPIVSDDDLKEWD